ncbi:MAG: DUF4861 domain-containing protein [Niabella sp.]|nr:DUF4861 domain-containing protein [Niabella sp.]
MRKLFVLIFVAGSLNAFAQPKTISVTNPSSIERKDELVVLKRSKLKRKLPALNSRQYVLINDEKVPQLVQYDDLNGDGIWDEAALLLDLKPNEKKVLTIAAADKPAAIKAVVRSYVRQKHKLADEHFGGNVLTDTMPLNNKPTDFSKQKLPPYLTEGPAWENDKVGFRKYFDTRNANDLWGKRTSKMVLDEVGADPSKSYHNLSDWGMDILKVGNSLGAGALALKVKTNGKDTVIRFGRNAQVIYKQITTGPIRSIFEMIYKNWEYLPDARPITVTEQISIWGGQYFFENKVKVDALPKDALLVTGTIDFFSKADYKINEKGVVGLYTYDRQSENKDMLGLGILTNIKNFKGYDHITASNTDITNAFTLEMAPVATLPVIYRYYVGWELTNPAFASKQGFEQFMHSEAEKFGKPVVVQ